MQVELISMTQKIDFKTGEILSSLEVEFANGLRTTLSIDEDKVLDVLRQMRAKVKDVEINAIFEAPPAKEDTPTFGGDFEPVPTEEADVEVARVETKTPTPSNITDEDGVSSI